MKIDIKSPLNIEQVKILLQKNTKLLFVLTEEEFSRTYIINLQTELPNYLVSEVKWLNRLYIGPSISTQTVLEHINEFYNCIKLFDKTAHDLVYLMADTFHINPNNKNELYHLKRYRSDKQRSSINKDWNYHFHGKGCSFTNQNTNQFLDVQIIHTPEFGVLDTYFLMRFIQTTESLKEMSVLLNDETKNMQKVIEVLWMNDYLVRLPNGNNNEFIINRNK